MPKPAKIQTRDDLRDGLARLMQDCGRPIRTIARKGDISTGTVQNLVSGKGRPTRRSVHGFLTGCGLAPDEVEVWLKAFDRAYPKYVASPSPADRWVMSGAQSGDPRRDFISSAHGHRGLAYDEDLFHGRVDAVAAVRAWFTSSRPPGRPLVITGQPGAGKSAVLARAVLELESLHGPRGVAVLARGATIADIIVAIAAGGALSGAATQDALLTQLQNNATDRLLIAVDALDEVTARTERAAIVRLLVSLARFPNLRVVVATRALATGDPHGVGSLLHDLGVRDADSQNLVHLDSDRYFDAAGLRAFAVAVLKQGPDDLAAAKYRTDVGLANRLAAVIAEKAERNYLVAALAANHLAGLSVSQDPAVAEFDLAAVPASVGDAISRYLDGLGERRVLALAMLTALAYSRGDGIDDRRWIRFGAALGYSLTQLDLDDLRESPGADYLVQTGTSDGHGVTRLFHQALVDDQLRRRAANRTADEAAIFASLTPVTSQQWWDVDAYPRRYAAEHANAARQLSRLLSDEHYLTVADLDRLVPLLSAGRATDLQIAAVLRRGSHRARELTKDRRAGLLAYSAASLGLGAWHQRFQALASHGNRLVWAHSSGSPHQQIQGDWTSVGGAAAVAIGKIGGRNVLASSVGHNGEIRLFDGIGAQIGEPLAAHESMVQALAIGRLGESEVIASAHSDGRVLLWDESGSLRGGTLVGHEGPVEAVAIGRLGARDVVASASDDCSVRLWDEDGHPIGEPLDDSRGPVHAVAIGRLGGRDVVACSVSWGSAIRLWDETGNAIGDLLTGHRGPIRSLAIGRLGDRDVVASASDDGTLRLWDELGVPIGEPLTGHDGEVRSVAIGRLDGREVLASAGDDGTVRLWDEAGVPIGEPLTGHDGKVRSVAMGWLGGREVVASLGYGGTVRLWDRIAAVGKPLPGHRRRVHTVAIGRHCGRDVIASHDLDGNLCMWDDAGRLIGLLCTGHQVRVQALAIGRYDGRDVIASGGDDDGAVVFWNDSGVDNTQRLTGHTRGVAALAIGSVDGQEVIASASHDGTVRIWKSGGNLIGTPLTRTDRLGMTAVAIGRLSDGDVIATTAGYDRAIHMWSASGALIGRPLTGHNAEITAVAIGSEIIVSADREGTIRLWDAIGAPIGEPLLGHRGPVRALAIGGPDGCFTIASAGYDGTVRIWDPTEPLAVQVYDFLDAVSDLAMLPDGRLCVAAGRSLSLWDPRSPSEI